MSWVDRILMRDQEVSGSEVSIQPQVRPVLVGLLRLKLLQHHA